MSTGNMGNPHPGYDPSFNQPPVELTPAMAYQIGYDYEYNQRGGGTLPAAGEIPSKKALDALKMGRADGRGDRAAKDSDEMRVLNWLTFKYPYLPDRDVDESKEIG